MRRMGLRWWRETHRTNHEVKDGILGARLRMSLEEQVCGKTKNDRFPSGGAMACYWT
jgi:hypothetical protein